MPGYFATRFVIGDRTIAEFLQNRNNWEVVNALIDDGIEGMTSTSLAEIIDLESSRPYLIDTPAFCENNSTQA